MDHQVICLVYAGHYYFAGNGRFREVSYADVYSATVTQGFAAFYTTPGPADWTANLHLFGTPPI